MLRAGEPVWVDRRDGGIDWDRVGVAVKARGVSWHAGLGYRVVDEQLLVCEPDGWPVLALPVWAVRSFDPARLRPWVAAALAGLEDPAEAARLLELINARQSEADDPPDDCWVWVRVDGVPLCVVHRGLLVDGWPVDDQGRPVEWVGRQPPWPGRR